MGHCGASDPSIDKLRLLGQITPGPGQFGQVGGISELPLQVNLAMAWGKMANEHQHKIIVQ